jgi:hypothetical protein
MNDQAVAALADVLHADRSLLTMYEEASEKVGRELSTMLDEAAADHRKHEQILSGALASAEMQMVEPGEDVREFMEAHISHVRSAREEGDVLETLAVAERVNSMLCAAAAREELPEELTEVIAEHHADERMHASVLEDRAPHHSGSRAARHGISCMTGGMTDDRNPDDFE